MFAYNSMHVRTSCWRTTKIILLTSWLSTSCINQLTNEEDMLCIMFAKLKESNKERKCCAEELNEGEYDFYIQESGFKIYDLRVRV